MLVLPQIERVSVLSLPTSAATEQRALLTAADLSLAYIQAVSAYWRGDSEFLPRFDTWLARFWTDGPPEPSDDPQAHCPHGAGGRGIRWYERGPLLLGYVTGKPGCFHVPRTAVLPRDTGRGGAVAVAHAIAA